jgi:hypothetical protein
MCARSAGKWDERHLRHYTSLKMLVRTKQNEEDEMKMKKSAARRVSKKFKSYDRSAGKPLAITPIEYGGLQEAYDHFNIELFDGKLPDVFITYQRRPNSAGYFSPDRFSGRVGKFGRHELALNPDGFIGQTDKQICQTLNHEMHHVWQAHCGTPSARGYHNKEWAAKMKANGLQPSSTGMVGGKETGQRMSDYIIPSGRFERAFEKLAATGWGLNLQSAHRPGPKGGTNSKTKFTCGLCGYNVWAKPPSPTGFPVCGACCVAAGININGFRMQAADTAVPAVAAPSPSYEINLPVDEPVKPKRGRPKGSKNKPKDGPGAAIQSYEQQPTKRLGSAARACAVKSDGEARHD